MSIFRNSEVDVNELTSKYGDILAENEQFEAGFKQFRDTILFTNKRLILVDVEGVTGSKIKFTTIPYKSIISFSKESAGWAGVAADFYIWIIGYKEPIKKAFNKDNNVNLIYQILSNYTLN